jgi:hypothetical protein
MKHYRSECDSGDDGFFPSDHSEMPSTREPSPEPFWDTAKRYGWREEELFPRPIPKANPAPILHQQIPTLHRQIPSAYSEQYRSSQLPSPRMQSTQTSTGLSLDYLAQSDATGLSVRDHLSQCDAREGCLELDVASDAALKVDYNSTVNRHAFDEMQRESMKLNRDTTWLRVVHCGYGQAAWRNQLKETRLTFVHGHFPAEGDYILVPAGRSAQAVVDMLVEVNIHVRKLVWFRAMKRANKSRLLFKWEPFTVPRIGHELPTLVEASLKLSK